MRKTALLGLDLGTSGTKVMAFDLEGRELARFYRAYPLANPAPGQFELDPDEVWRAAADGLRHVASNLDDHRIEALSIAAQGEAVIPIDRTGKALAMAPVSADQRGEAHAEALATELGDAWIYGETGQPVSSLPTITKLMWWKTERPALHEQTSRYLCFGELALFRLGLEPTIDPSMAARTMAFGIERGTWSAEILDAAGLDADRLPPIRPSGTIVGAIPDTIAKSLSLPSGVQVVLGGHDQPMAALGAGVIGPSQALYSIGTTEAILSVVDGPSTAFGRSNIPCYPHVLADRWVTLVGNQSGGRLLAWYRHNMTLAGIGDGDHQAPDFDDLTATVDLDRPSGLLLLPHFAGSGSVLNDPNAKGALVGLTFDTSPGDLVKAVLEGITFEQALGVRALEEAGIKIDRLHAVGGGAHSSIWLQIKADILGLPISPVAIADAPCLGAALLAGIAIGAYPSPEEAVARAITIRPAVPPVANRNKAYANMLERYRELYQALRALCSWN
ncbi:MAG: FGGY family carbohydrate kinase [Alphaproteobacteria bacterium]|nr:FGGY family carbohydrate kinase [Alphaproteobacteria bacterium]